MIAQNDVSQGVTVTTGTIGSALHFCNESSKCNNDLADSSISYLGGNLIIDVLKQLAKKAPH